MSSATSTSGSLVGFTHTITLTNSAVSPSSTSYNTAAFLTQSDTTVTAFQVPGGGTTGLFVVDGTTLTFQQQDGITLSDGHVISAGSNGLEGAGTTAEWRPIGGSPSSSDESGGSFTIETINPSLSGTVDSLTANPETRTTLTSPSPSSGGIFTIETINPSLSGTIDSLTANPETRTSSAASSSGSGSGNGRGSASSSSTAAAAAVLPTLGAGKAIALLGALGGMVVLGL
ncbi:uncharacterized protein LTR77_003086 [Saxophila tyrrhenica]|uniref:Uncharacterized protein n=1 Tax=Saxophila tyrrhenica TaxID=1690608 RepID=A0AAV9PGF5_9PEZI|nr:hypothetical protein LTR77_003086 [Saxophila tyrrhenica]